MKKVRKGIELELDVKNRLENMGKEYNPPLKLKTYIEYILKEFSLGNLIKLKK